MKRCFSNARDAARSLQVLNTVKIVENKIKQLALVAMSFGLLVKTESFVENVEKLQHQNLEKPMLTSCYQD